MKFSKMTFLPLVGQLGEYLLKGIDHYASLKAAGMEINEDLIAMFLAQQMKDWNPKVKGKTLLDPETKEAACRFLAGVAFNLSK